MDLFKKKKEVETALQICLADHASSFQEAQSFLGFAKVMRHLKEPIKAIPKRLKRSQRAQMHQNAF